jgi:V/A-type H+-transporting ATPase subunit I
VTIGGLKCLTNASVKDANVQAFCFLLAVAQLTMGRIWSSIRSRNLRKTLSDFGWILILWGNFFLTLRIIVWQGEFPVFMYWLFGIGLALVVLFGINWKDIADVFQFPFAIINSFTDILSYIRLFAVGMSGACIAQSFNGMAMDVAKASPWFIIVSVIILLAGHILNLVMALMGVLVHAVRLNTLEFSNHTGLTWCGKEFRPFKDRNNSK